MNGYPSSSSFSPLTISSNNGAFDIIEGGKIKRVGRN